MSAEYERVADAIDFLVERAGEQPSLAELAAHLGLSESHAQRLFTRWAGISPKRFIQALTVEHAKTLLRESVPVLEASFAVGLSAPSRLHDLTVTVEAATPGEIGAGGFGLRIEYGVHETPFGPAVLALTDRGLCGLEFVRGRAAGEALEAVRRAWPKAEMVSAPERTAIVARRVFGKLAGAVEDQEREPLAVHLKGTNHQLQVWRALLRIPDGCLISYGDLAARIGRPNSSRAVANAVGANPVAYVIPCHRVLRSTGAIGGYAGGLALKRAMLVRETA